MVRVNHALSQICTIVTMNTHLIFVSCCMEKSLSHVYSISYHLHSCSLTLVASTTFLLKEPCLTLLCLTLPLFIFTYYLLYRRTNSFATFHLLYGYTNTQSILQYIASSYIWFMYTIPLFSMTFLHSRSHDIKIK